MRFQVGWSGMHRAGLGDNNAPVIAALKEAGAVNVRERHGFGWRNQPRTPTFTAKDEREARRLLDKVEAIIGHPYTLSAAAYTRVGE
jgi:hypothetical protein